MSRIGSKNTSPERKINSWLARNGIGGYRRNDGRFPGSPDFLFEEERVAIFYNSKFWHCRDPIKIAKMKPYWRRKFVGNFVRDVKAWMRLRMLGFRVLTLWDDDLDDLNILRTVNNNGIR
jgi:DNA mismatch endonuclease (patch repair protein)